MINAKVSTQSQKRYLKFPSFSVPLFQKIDHICAQTKEYQEKFTSLSVSAKQITQTGNLKFSSTLPSLSPKEKKTWQKQLGLPVEKPIITIGSSHEGEEELLLPYLTQYTVLLVPRHPERFSKVRKWLETQNYPNVILVDQMGILPICYQLSSLAIVGGSFIPGIGGHNIFEPIQASIPVLFGPYMETQQEMVTLILSAKAGIQTEAKNLPEALAKAFDLTDNAKLLSKNNLAPLERTWEAIQPYMQTT